MKIKRRYIQLFLDLNSSEKGILGFSISHRYNLQLTDVVDFIVEYQKKGYITCDEEYRIELTDEGREAITSLFEKGVVPHYQSESAYFNVTRTESKIAINEPYIPRKDFYSFGKQKDKEGENKGN